MQKREIWKVVVLGLITLGIYDIYWLIATRREMVQRGETIPSIWLLFAPVLGLVVIAILQFLPRFALRGSGPEGYASSGIANTIELLSVLVGLLALIAFIPLFIYWTYKYCKAVEHITHGQTTFNMAFWSAVILNILNFGFIWPGLIQDGFNKVSASDSPVRSPAPYQSPYPPTS